MTRLGYQIPNFTYPETGPDAIFGNVIEQAKAAEASGFDRIFLMDHFYQLPGIGDPDDPMLECYTTLAALSQHHAFCIAFNSFSERFEKLEEALQIIAPMLKGERPTLDGKHYQVKDVINSPAPISDIPIMIGGSGEKKTLRMVAQYADESNLTCSVPKIPRRLEALAAHCERLGRDRSEIKVTKLVMMVIGNTHEEAMASLGAYAELHGWPREVVELMVPQLVIGDPDSIGEQIAEMMAVGLDGVTLNLATVGHNPEMVALAGKTASAAIG